MAATQRSSSIIQIDGREIKLSRPEKVLFPEDGITKGDLVDYYRRISERMLPHLKGRPLSVERLPDGIGKASFFQKAVPSYFPDWIGRATVAKVGGTVTHPVCDDAATLVYLANQACIVLHPWLSRADKPDRPDQMIFDLDPPQGDNGGVIQAAKDLKDLLDKMGLPAYLKTTGSRGLHVVVPLDRKEDFDSVRTFARAAAETLVTRNPDLYTLEARKVNRGERVYIDINRNAYAQTAVAPYSVRAIAGAPIALPIEWSNLRKKNLLSTRMGIKDVELVLQAPDSWKDFGRHPARLGPARSADRSRVTK